MEREIPRVGLHDNRTYGPTFAAPSVQRHAVPYSTVHNWDPDTKGPLSNHLKGDVTTLNVYVAGANTSVPKAFCVLCLSSFTTSIGGEVTLTGLSR
jgi:hypothetical protein